MKNSYVTHGSERSVRLKLISECRDSSEAIAAAAPGEDPDLTDIPTDRIEFTTEAHLTVSDGRITVDYDDREIFEGVDDASSTLVFDESNRGLVTLIRKGTVSSALVFEQGKRHLCIYRTPYAPFEFCIRTETVKNRLTERGGTLFVDYYTEVHGVVAEHTKLHFTVSPIAE